MLAVRHFNNSNNLVKGNVTMGIKFVVEDRGADMRYRYRVVIESKKGKQKNFNDIKTIFEQTADSLRMSEIFKVIDVITNPDIDHAVGYLFGRNLIEAISSISYIDMEKMRKSVQLGNVHVQFDQIRYRPFGEKSIYVKWIRTDLVKKDDLELQKILSGYMSVLVTLPNSQAMLLSAMQNGRDAIIDAILQCVKAEYDQKVKEFDQIPKMYWLYFDYCKFEDDSGTERSTNIGKWILISTDCSIEEFIEQNVEFVEVEY